MGKIDKNIRYGFQSFIQYAMWFFACTCCFVLCTCLNLNAKQKGPPIEFVESITEDEDGKSPLAIATELENEEMIELLEWYGAAPLSE